MRRLRCYCGQTVIQTSQVGNPPDCMGCDECHSTLASSQSLCKQRKLHEWEHQGNEKICVSCNAREVAEVVRKEYAMIFLNDDGDWINNKGEIIADKLVAKYDIPGRFLRNGEFDARDDIRSMEVNKEIVIEKEPLSDEDYDIDE